MTNHNSKTNFIVGTWGKYLAFQAEVVYIINKNDIFFPPRKHFNITADL